jgi:hypothetical protein
MSFQLFTDRQELFEAKIKIEGASLNESFCRLVIESDEWNLVFKGTIDKSGNCSIPIKKLRNVLPEGTIGKMKLEVIAEDTYFVPWESEFKVEVAKSVQVEVKQQKSTKSTVVMETVKPQATADVITKSKPKTPINLQESNRKLHLKQFAKTLLDEGVTLQNVREHKKRINELSNELIFNHNINEDTRKWIVNNTIKILAKKAK